MFGVGRKQITPNEGK